MRPINRGFAVFHFQFFLILRMNGIEFWNRRIWYSWSVNVVICAFLILPQMSRTDDRVTREEYEKLVRELEVVYYL